MEKNVKEQKNKKKNIKSAAKAQKSVEQKNVVKRDNSDVNPEFTDAFIQEVNEDVKNDNFRVMWNRYGIFVISFVVIAVCAAVSFDKIRSWKIQQNQRETENYMLAAQVQENPEDTIASLQNINKYNQGIFGDFARLQIANVLLGQQKNEEAFAELQGLIDDKQVNEEVKQIALIKLATYKVDELPFAEMKKMLQPVMDANNSWTPLANDLLAMAAIRDGDLQTAKEIYDNLLKVKDLPEGFRAKVQDILSSISDM